MRVVGAGFVIAALSGAAAAGATACSAFSAAESDDSPPVTTAEAGADASFESDAGVADDRLEVDAGPFCASVDAQFCWSFDSVQLPLLGPRLTAQSTGDPATVVDASLSPPNAMATSLTGPGNTGVRLDVATDVAHLRCELDVFFDMTDSGTGVVVTFANLDWAGSFFNLPYLTAIRTDPSTIRASLVFGGAGSVDLGNLPTGAWVRAFLDTDIVDGQWIVRGGVGDNAAGAFDAGARATLPRFDKVFFGLGTLAWDVHWAARYDNLVCYWH